MLGRVSHAPHSLTSFPCPASHRWRLATRSIPHRSVFCFLPPHSRLYFRLVMFVLFLLLYPAVFSSSRQNGPEAQSMEVLILLRIKDYLEEEYIQIKKNFIHVMRFFWTGCHSIFCLNASLKAGHFDEFIKATLCRFLNLKRSFQNHCSNSLTCKGDNGTPAIYTVCLPGMV